MRSAGSDDLNEATSLQVVPFGHSLQAKPASLVKVAPEVRGDSAFIDCKQTERS